MVCRRASCSSLQGPPILPTLWVRARVRVRVRVRIGIRIRVRVRVRDRDRVILCAVGRHDRHSKPPPHTADLTLNPKPKC